MALANSIDPASARERLGPWLAARLDGATDVEVTDLDVPRASGISNETVLFGAHWRADGEEHTGGFVARVAPRAEGVIPTYGLATEFAVLSALRGTDVAVPAARWHEPGDDVLGAPFVVSDRVAGRGLADDPPFTVAGWIHDLPPERRARVSERGVRALAGVHAADPSVLDGVPGLHRGAAAQLDLYEAFRARIRASGGADVPTIDAALAVLRERTPDEPDLRISWGDARLGNLLFDDEQDVSAVLDWEMVGLGAPGMDLGWWLFFDRHHTEGIGAALPEGMADRDATIALYAEAAGSVPEHLDFYEALAAFRTAVMMTRAAQIMAAAGLLPPENTLAQSNPMVQLLAQLLGLPAPEAASTHFIGNR